jgi:hypothetical protein
MSKISNQDHQSNKPSENLPKNKIKKSQRKQKERKLDKTIEDTFPASDATAKY